MTLGTKRPAIAALAAVAFMGAAAQPERLARANSSTCRYAHGDITRYCGAATARLSVFPGIDFSSGSCTRRRSGGVQLLTIRIGAKSRLPGVTNDGLTLFTLQLTGPPTRPTSGLVLAYFRSKYWQGRSVSFHGGARVGTFLAQAVFPSRGQATGSYRCPAR
jgi:hypothetical protein